jgi:hypothetical protein
MTVKPDQPDTTAPSHEERVDPQIVFDGAKAVGELTGGVGGLLLGAAKAKEAFGGDTPSTPPTPTPAESESE